MTTVEVAPVAEFERLAEALAGLYDVYTPEGVGVWLKGAKRSFGGRSPLQMIREGRVNELSGRAERLRSL